MKISLILATLVVSSLCAQAVTNVVDTTTNSYSIEDRGTLSLTNTGQTFTTGSLGSDDILSKHPGPATARLSSRHQRGQHHG